MSIINTSKFQKSIFSVDGQRMKMKHQIWEEKKIVMSNLTVVTAATSGSPRACTEWLLDVAGVVQLSKPGNVRTEVDYNPKPDS